MPNAVKQFPRGYGGGQVQAVETHEIRPGDPEVKALWIEFTKPTPENKFSTWKNTQRVLKTAMRLFNYNGANYLTKIDSESLDYDYKKEFILDTIRYIGTGKRKMSMSTWSTLITDHPEGSASEEDEADFFTKAFSENNVPTRIDNMIQKWCSYPGGLNDLMYTLNLLFGEIKIRLED